MRGPLHGLANQVTPTATPTLAVTPTAALPQPQPKGKPQRPHQTSLKKEAHSRKSHRSCELIHCCRHVAALQEVLGWLLGLQATLKEQGKEVTPDSITECAPACSALGARPGAPSASKPRAVTAAACPPPPPPCASLAAIRFARDTLKAGKVILYTLYFILYTGSRGTRSRRARSSRDMVI